MPRSNPRLQDIEPRFRDKVQVAPSGCWNWTGSRTDGYGQYSVQGRLVRAHRYAYEVLVGPIPTGLCIDHLCRNPSCVNPEHLEPVTNRENVLRGVGLPAQNVAKTHCPKGHPLDGRAKGPHGPTRFCRTCTTEIRTRPEWVEYSREYNRTRRAAIAGDPRPDGPSGKVCKHGHEKDGWSKGQWFCRTCARLAARIRTGVQNPRLL